MIARKILVALPSTALIALLTALACTAPAPLPTYTPYPTYTPPPFPTATPVVLLSQKLSAHSSCVFSVDKAHESAAVKSCQPLIIYGCYAGLYDYRLGETWRTFSKDGRFDKDRVFVSIGGMKAIREGECYEMSLDYEGEESFCYWTECDPAVEDIQRVIGGCSCGWTQMTHEFYLASPDAIRYIPKYEWRRDYQE